VPDAEWSFWERWYIAYFKFIGCRLTNTTLGGEGVLGFHRKHTEKEKLAVSKSLMGNTYGLGNHNRLGKYHGASTRNRIGDRQLVLTNEQVADIRKLRQAGSTFKELSKLYKVSKVTIKRAVRGMRGYDRRSPSNPAQELPYQVHRGCKRLTKSHVKELRRLYTLGWSYTHLAQRFGVSRETAKSAALGRAAYASF
jgi:hypothetical protein